MTSLKSKTTIAATAAIDEAIQKSELLVHSSDARTYSFIWFAVKFKIQMFGRDTVEPS